MDVEDLPCEGKDLGLGFTPNHQCPTISQSRGDRANSDVEQQEKAKEESMEYKKGTVERKRGGKGERKQENKKKDNELTWSCSMVIPS